MPPLGVRAARRSAGTGSQCHLQAVNTRFQAGGRAAVQKVRVYANTQTRLASLYMSFDCRRTRRHTRVSAFKHRCRACALNNRERHLLFPRRRYRRSPRQSRLTDIRSCRHREISIERHHERDYARASVCCGSFERVSLEQPAFAAE